VNPQSLQFVFDGWDGYNASLRSAVEPRTAEELAWRPSAGLSSVGEVVAHLAFARPAWFSKMDAPGALALHERYVSLRGPDKQWLDSALLVSPNRLVEMLDETWWVIKPTLERWTVEDLPALYRLEYEGVPYAFSRQWMVWRVLSHDMHHGGQLSQMLYQQGIDIPELGDRGGHLTEPPVWQD